MKEYKAIVWPADRPDEPGQRVTLEAVDAKAAGDWLKTRYGDDAVYTVWNEEDANRPRG